MGKFRKREEINHDKNPDIRYSMALKRVQRIKGFYNHLLAYIVFNTIIIFTNYGGKLGTEAFWHFKTFSIAFFWGIGLLAHAASVFGQHLFFGSQWEERKIQEIMDRQKGEKWE